MEWTPSCSAMELALICRLRWVRTKMKQAGLLITCLLLLVLLKHEVELGQVEVLPQPRLTQPRLVLPALAVEDQFISLQAELGYLRKKLAQCGGQVPSQSGDLEHFPPIYVITPTHSRPVQLAELKRLQSVFLMVPNLHWILVEDAEQKTKLVTDFLARSGLSFTHLNVATPEKMKLKTKDPHWSKPRGVEQRNAGISWLRDKLKKPDAPGVVYFADDDNTYSLDLFEMIRTTRKVSVFPVGLVGGVLVERPLSSSSGQLTGWSVGWGRDRPFATDMAGFAVNVGFLLSRPAAKFLGRVKIGYLESEFLKRLVADEKEEVDVVGGDTVMVWHTRTENVNLNMEAKFKTRTGHGSDHGTYV